MKKNEISPLETLRQEKEIVRREVAESEERLSDHWAYLSDNAPSLIFNAAIGGITGWLGFGHKHEAKSQDRDTSTESDNGVMHNVLGTLNAYTPLIWEIVQPMLLRYAVNKVKSIFTRKKKKHKYDD